MVDVPARERGEPLTEGADRQRGRVVSADKAAKVSPEQMEIARLRAENARLRMERDIAKKAAAYFAQDTLRGTPGFTK